MFWLGHNNRIVWKLPDDPPIVEIIAKFPTKFMFFGGISWDSRTELVPIEGTLDADGYKQLISEHLQRPLFVPANELCQDGATPHTARTTTEYCEDWNITVNQLPPHSPELNPIEKVWALMKQRINQQIVTSEQELIALVQRTWKELPQSTIQQYITHYQTVMNDLIASGGDNINEWHRKHRTHPY